jgi:hypothetical protein
MAQSGISDPRLWFDRNMDCDLEFRKSESDISIGAYCLYFLDHQERPVFSPDYYAFSLNSRRTRKISSQEWDRAVPAPISRAFPAGGGLKGIPDRLVYKGRDFPMTGVGWGLHNPEDLARLSRGGSFVAVYSWNGGATHEIYYADLYKVDSRQRMLAILGKFGGGTAHEWMFRHSGWLSDNYYIFPQDRYGLRQLLFCDIGQLTDGKKEKP